MVRATCYLVFSCDSNGLLSKVRVDGGELLQMPSDFAGRSSLFRTNYIWSILRPPNSAKLLKSGLVRFGLARFVLTNVRAIQWRYLLRWDQTRLITPFVRTVRIENCVFGFDPPQERFSSHETRFLAFGAKQI